MLFFVNERPTSPALTRCISLICLAGTLVSGWAALAQTSVQADQPAPAATPVVISLQDAIKRAQASEPNYANSVANAQVAGLDKSIARAGLLPRARFNGQGLYVQPNGLREVGGEGVVNTNPKFVSADARPREYIAQGIVEETVSLGGIAAVRRANAADAVAKAELEIARRGLVEAVTGLYYGVISADHKLSIAQQAAQEAADFNKLTGQREHAREAAHADTIKAQLQQQQRDRELSDAKLNADKARLELGVLLFSDPRTPFTLAVTAAPVAFATREDFNQLASKNNVELKSALATLNASSADVLTAQAAYLPSIGLNYTYGIDANEFATRGPLTPDGIRTHNLGYSAAVTVNLPVWDWLATEHKVKQSEIKRDAAKTALSATQRRTIAMLDESYAEAQGARAQLASLDDSVATAAESLRLTKLRYTGGEATVLEVVDAQTAYITAQNAREDGRVRFETALAQLQTLTGTI
ncbi:MAG: TolC family protein [Acidobacteria bacterium]|nr:TolC family protein [Acidobacteriota bacterium]